MANCLMLLTKVGEIGGETNPSKDQRELIKDDGDFKCKTCNKRFSSFQALGGHRASHKKPKLMVVDDLKCHHHHHNSKSPKRTMKLKPKMHPCPICGVEFGIGQALGGHMRKHRASINDDGLLIHKPNTLQMSKKSRDVKTLNLCLDLNLALAPPDSFD
ncbi:hypothetical protein RIF29_27759 [Crotalaria pallida]|uniref:C2H2-type domain-containing protein n=1 Tax=Crotalaria pallida TaxID=3830 RepID=A0AAN9EQ65_CROPI